jgi:hypothetical protein
MIEKTEYQGFPNCLSISNGDAKLVVSTDFGPRVLHYALDGGENILGWHPEAAVKTELGSWKPYGGHRLWLAPENMPLSYAPDNGPVEYEVDGDLSVTLTQEIEARTRTQKQIVLTLDAEGSGAIVHHRITNNGRSALNVSAWALTIMRPGGEAVVPNEPFKPYNSENLLPVRSMALWSYTDFTDPRWSFEKGLIRLRVDENVHSQQKFGVLNKQGWAAYRCSNLLFVKRFDFIDRATYPDMNSNTEIYTAGSFIEVESLSPLKQLQPGDTISHTERWELFMGEKASQI